MKIIGILLDASKSNETINNTDCVILNANTKIK